MMHYIVTRKCRVRLPETRENKDMLANKSDHAQKIFRGSHDVVQVTELRPQAR